MALYKILKFVIGGTALASALELARTSDELNSIGVVRFGRAALTVGRNFFEYFLNKLLSLQLTRQLLLRLITNGHF